MRSIVRGEGSLRRNVTRARVTSVRDGAKVERPDRLAAEEPMEIRAHGPGSERIDLNG